MRCAPGNVARGDTFLSRDKRASHFCAQPGGPAFAGLWCHSVVLLLGMAVLSLLRMQTLSATLEITVPLARSRTLDTMGRSVSRYQCGRWAT